MGAILYAKRKYVYYKNAYKQNDEGSLISQAERCKNKNKEESSRGSKIHEITLGLTWGMDEWYTTLYLFRAEEVNVSLPHAKIFLYFSSLWCFIIFPSVMKITSSQMFVDKSAIRSKQREILIR